ncbi:MAG: ClpXP protease specificity-enhancing factor SspB, partial [Bacteroidota bacterium]
KERFPDEMTIVLQNKFWELEVREAGFGVGLSFNQIPAKLDIPFAAITAFVDPAVDFGLQFQATVADMEPEAHEDAENDGVASNGGTEDNDGDHRGERERLVYLINGSDCGWRTNWQFGKYTDPKNNTYKVWMDEKLHLPRWEGQAAYILPPITNYVNGPTGMVYNPGTALSPAWYDHFFIAEFRGSPANSPVHAFKLKPKGASFELDTTYIAVKGLLPTGLDFGPDGALYMGDWIDGWGTKDAGRIWKLDVPGEENSNIRRETKGLIEADFGESSTAELSEYLSHQDMRIRQKAQFELVGKGRRGYKSLLAVAQQSNNQLARIHALWGIGQLSRKKLSYAKAFEDYLTDDDTEIVVQAAKMIGDVHYEPSAEILLTLLEHSSLRVRLHATEALGRIGYKTAVQ